MAVDSGQRREFEYRVLDSMRCPTFDFEAFANGDDLEGGCNAIHDVERLNRATTYRFIFHIPTLSGPGTFSSRTDIGVDLDVRDYPLQPPSTWIISDTVPWSPHFRRGAPVCIGGEFWLPKRGHVTLGHLAIHLARLLNWDEKGRGPGYVGWNAQAIAYHKQVYGSAPLDPSVVYPKLPRWLSGTSEEHLSFEIVGGGGQLGPNLDFKIL